MGKIYRSITELVGKTPLLELANYEKKHDLPAKLLVKLEYFNPHSHKGRLQPRLCSAGTDHVSRNDGGMGKHAHGD